MRLKSILFFEVSVALFSFAYLMVVFNNQDPFNLSNLNYSIYYLDLLIFLCCFISIILIFIKTRLANTLLVEDVLRSNREALFIAIPLTVITILRGIRILDWWLAVFIILLFILIGLFFESKHKNRTK